MFWPFEKQVSGKSSGVVGIVFVVYSGAAGKFGHVQLPLNSIFNHNKKHLLSESPHCSQNAVQALLSFLQYLSLSHLFSLLSLSHLLFLFFYVHKYSVAIFLFLSLVCLTLNSFVTDSFSGLLMSEGSRQAPCWWLHSGVNFRRRLMQLTRILLKRRLSSLQVKQNMPICFLRAEQNKQVTLNFQPSTLSPALKTIFICFSHVTLWLICYIYHYQRGKVMVVNTKTHEQRYQKSVTKNTKRTYEKYVK